MPGPLRGVLQHLPGALPRQPPAAGVEEHRRRCPCRAAAQVGPAPHEVGVERARPRGDRPARSAACRPCRAAARPRVGVDVVDVEPDRLGDPRAGRVEQLEQRPVAQRQRTVGLAVAARTVEQGEHLVDRQALRAAGGSGVGGLTARATSSSVTPSAAAKRCSPRTAISARARRRPPTAVRRRRPGRRGAVPPGSR